jgi:glycosyltransferase involved in cell wall biosynthesis
MNSLPKQQHKILIDLLPALSGFAGIPQESRLLFKTLAVTSDQVGGLIYSSRWNALLHNIDTVRDNKTDLVACAHFLSDLMNDASTAGSNNTTPATTLAKIKQALLHSLSLAKLFTKRSFTLKELNTAHFYDFLWRVLFSKTLMSDDYSLLQNQRYFISTLNNHSMRLASDFNYNVKLDTRGWDFVIFQFLRNVQVSPGTTKIIRYHDSIALKDMDVAVPGGAAAQGADLLRSTSDSYYVCNSGPTRDDLVAIAPELEDRSCVIPPILADYKKTLHQQTLLHIIRRGFSSLLLNEERQKQIHEQISHDSDFRYILILGTLEPRKNHITLIRAWERIRAYKQSSLKLVVVGSPGWKYSDIASAMKPHVRDGNIIHLEKILPEDMSYLYSHADAFVFPSYNEGFGIPPLEAMQCECPVIVSDIGTHRWVCADAALYCNPYDVDSLVKCLESLLFATDSMGLRQELINKGLERVKLYSADRIGEMWQSLFQRIRTKC